MKNLVLIDGHSLAYRMYFALERTQMHTASKIPTWGVYGFFKALFDLLKQQNPDGIAIAFDVSRESFRTEMFPEYKATRKSMPDSLREQLTKIREGIDLLGIPVFEVVNYEADDLIGTLAHQAANQGIEVAILTGDQDAFQVIDGQGKISILVPGFQGGLKRYQRQEVFEKWGVYPEQVTDFKGLKGDTSDNIPGVPGIGDKTAAKLLAEYQTLENVLDNVEAISGAKLKESLVKYRDQAILSKKLATILYDAPVEFSKDACHLKIPHLDDFLQFLAELEFKSFINQRATILKPFLGETGLPDAEDVVAVKPTNGKAKASGQLEILETQVVEADTEILVEKSDVDLLPPYEVPFEIICDEKKLAVFVDKIKTTNVFSIDIETSGLDFLTTQLAGIAIAWSPVFTTKDRNPKNLLNLETISAFDKILSLKGDAKDTIEAVYIPLIHAECDNPLSLETVLKYLKPLLEDPDVIQICHNGKFEKKVFRNHGVETNGLIFDTMVASYVINADRRHGLKLLAHDVLGCRMQEIEGLIGKGKKQIPFTEVPLEKAAPYAACDAYVTLQLAEKFLQQLDDDLTDLLYETELPLVHVLADMEWQGVSLDTDYLKKLNTHLETSLAKVEAEIYELAGLTFNLNSPKQVGEVLFEKMEIPAKGYTKGKTAFSTNAKVLESLAPQYPIVQKLLDYRQLFKLKSTYVDTLPALISEKDHRLHASFNQTVAATGRLSSSDPNLQNIPIRTELGREIRQAFVPAERKDWFILSADYSQIELRLLAHFSEDKNLMNAFQSGEDVHKATAALVFGVALENVNKDMRYKAKAVNFGIIYGQTAFGLSQALKIPPKEASEFIERYFRQYPKVKKYIDASKEDIRKTGVVTTLLGRRRDFSEGLNAPTKHQREFAERAAFNMPLQGSAADLMKLAMIRLQEKLKSEKLKSKLILQVHDELVLEVADSEKDQIRELVSWAMALEQPLRVPLEIDISEGPSWMEA